MEPRREPLPLPWACLLTAGATFSTLAVYGVLLGAYSIAELFSSLRWAAWALDQTRWFPASACALDAAILLVTHHAGPPTRRTTRHALRLLVAAVMVAIIPYRVWWWSPMEICR